MIWLNSISTELIRMAHHVAEKRILQRNACARQNKIPLSIDGLAISPDCAESDKAEITEMAGIEMSKVISKVKRSDVQPSSKVGRIYRCFRKETNRTLQMSIGVYQQPTAIQNQRTLVISESLPRYTVYWSTWILIIYRRRIHSIPTSKLV